MREFKSLNPEKTPEGFDAEIHGEEPLVELEESKGRIFISYAFPGFYFSDDILNVKREKISFKQVSIAGTGFIAESGKPLLPSFGRYVQIPFNYNFKFTVKKGKAVKFDNILVSPAQVKVTDNPKEEHILEYDNKIYAKDTFYPEEVVKITGPFNIDDYQALLIHVCPLQYNPAKKQLRGYGNITITIDLVLKEEEKLDYPAPGDPALNREGFGNLFLNPRRRIEERLEISPGRIVFPPYWRLRGPEFLIIYYKNFKQAAGKLAKWKNMRGLRTEIVPIDTVGNIVTDIKTYIRNKRKYIFSRLRYVLLLGDVDMIKCENIHGNITDFYYSTPSDPPVGSNEYIIPWLSIGRIPVRTLEEATGVVDQIINYEKNPPIDPDYYERMAFAAYFQDNNQDNQADIYRYYMKTMEAIREHMITLGFDIERIYVTNSPNPQFYADGTPVPSDVVSSIVNESIATNMLIDATTDGQLFIGHRDHGSPDGWSHPSFNRNHLDSITGDIPTPFYSLNCSTGMFDLPAPTECFAEKILRIKAAAPSLIAPTRDSNTFLNNDMMKALFDAMWGGVLPTFPGATASYPVRRNRLGDILNYAKTYLPTRISSYAIVHSVTVQDHFEIFHVLGDPTLELLRTEPLKIKMRAIVRKGYLYIRLSSCPKDSVITVWYREKMLKRLEPSSSYIKIALKELVPLPRPPWRVLRPEVLVCFWAPGYRFTQVRPRMDIRWPILPV